MMTVAEIRAAAERVLAVTGGDQALCSIIYWAAWRAGIEPHEATDDVMRALMHTRAWADPLSVVRYYPADQGDWGRVSIQVNNLRWIAAQEKTDSTP